MGGGGGADALFPQGFDPLPTLRVTDPKIFLKAPLAPIYTNFEDSVPKKRHFFKQNFAKSAQKRLF